MIANQNPEQLVRDQIDKMLQASGWQVQSKKQINLAVNVGVAVREYQTNVGPADYILFVNKKPVGVIEAKREEEGIHLTMHEDQTEGYAKAKLRLIDNAPLVFAYESTGEVTRFTDYRDPKPRSRPVFTFHRPETFKNWLQEGKSLRASLHDIPALCDGNSSPKGGGWEGALRDCQVEAITQGAKIAMGEYIGKREKLTRKQFWQTADEEVNYTAKQLDRDVVNPNQIRLIVRTIKEQLPLIFPDRVASSQPSPRGEGATPSPQENAGFPPSPRERVGVRRPSKSPKPSSSPSPILMPTTSSTSFVKSLVKKISSVKRSLIMLKTLKEY